MGLFSFLSKNKQDTTGKDSGYYSADDQARSKRASHAGAPAAKRAKNEAADPVLPEKKRARRRLVGAVALALGVAIGLPMLLDSEPKPLGADIAIQIPAKDKPAAAERGASTVASASKVAASAALDQSEEIVTLPLKSVAKAPPAAPKAEPKPVADIKPAESKLVEAKPAAKPVEAKPAEPRHDVKAETKAAEAKAAEAKHDAKAEAKAAEAKHDAKAEAKAAEAKHEVKTLELKAEAKREAKAAEPPKASGDAARAQAILEGKPAAPATPAAASGKYVVQVAALANQEKIDELQAKLKEAGIKFYTQKVPTQAGDRTRIRVGPFASKEEAEKMRAKLVKAGLGGSLVPA
jgi:DedD protein